MKHLSAVLAACLLAIPAMPTVAQTRTQTTTVRKQSYDNPTIALAEFSGSAAHRAKLEEILIRCDWFKVLGAAQAANAQIRLSAQVTDGSPAQFAATIQANGKTVPVSLTADNPQLAILQGTDAILNVLFGIKGPCASKIVFVRHSPHNVKELVACYLDGSDQKQLTFNKAISSEPSWGHANALVYTLAKSNALNIILMDYVNANQRIISHSKGLNSSAALSHNGRYVALALSRDNFVDLYVLDLANNSYKRLTKDNSVESSPCWSPDDSKICFVSDAIRIGSPRLYIVPADGSTPPKRISGVDGECVSPDWSSNNQLTFATKGPYGKYAIAVLDLNTPNAKPDIVTAADGDWEAPSWSPDNRHVICTRTRGKARDLYLVDTRRGSFQAITEGAVLSLPAWQPAR